MKTDVDHDAAGLNELLLNAPIDVGNAIDVTLLESQFCVNGVVNGQIRPILGMNWRSRKKKHVNEQAKILENFASI